MICGSTQRSCGAQRRAVGFPRHGKHEQRHELAAAGYVHGVQMRDPEMIDWPWWPKGRKATCRYGDAGHDYEFVVNIAGYGFGRDEEMIPTLVGDELAYLLEGMKLENRGSRIEIHPSGHLFRTVPAEQVAAAETQIREALETIGLTIADSLWD